MNPFLAWAWFVVVQLLSILATIVGWVVLLPFCALQAWKPVASSFEPTRLIDEWSWKPLNWVYGNPEDGVSGAQALVWAPGGLERVEYLASAGSRWRAYCWSAWRNSADNLKYVFAWSKGPYRKWTIRGREIQAGWKSENGVNVPVLS